MHKVLTTLRRHYGAFAAVFTTAFLGLTAVSSATPQYDLSPVSSDITSEIGGNLTTILLIFGSILALVVGLKLIKRFSH